MKNKYLFIDVGNTLLHIKHSPDKVYFEILKKYGLISNTLSENDKSIALWSSWKDLESHLPPDFKDRYAHHPGGNNGWWIELINLFLFRINGISKSPEAIVFEEIFAAFDNPDMWEVDESFYELNNYLITKNIGLGIISNWDLRLRKLLENKGLLYNFEYILISAEFGYEKPSPLIFDKAKELAGVPENCLTYVGDKMELDYEPAISLGWDAYLISRTESKEPHIINKLGDLIHRKNWDL